MVFIIISFLFPRCQLSVGPMVRIFLREATFLSTCRWLKTFRCSTFLLVYFFFAKLLFFEGSGHPYIRFVSIVSIVIIDENFCFFDFLRMSGGCLPMNW